MSKPTSGDNNLQGYRTAIKLSRTPIQNLISLRKHHVDLAERMVFEYSGCSLITHDLYSGRRTEIHEIHVMYRKFFSDYRDRHRFDIIVYPVLIRFRARTSGECDCSVPYPLHPTIVMGIRQTIFREIDYNSFSSIDIRRFDIFSSVNEFAKELMMRIKNNITTNQ